MHKVAMVQSRVLSYTSGRIEGRLEPAVLGVVRFQLVSINLRTQSGQLRRVEDREHTTRDSIFCSALMASGMFSWRLAASSQ